jgi:CheY-like chemotaxis protein
MGRIQNILVVDDSEEVREFAAMLLTDAGYNVEQAADGVEAFELARRRRPDLILLDVVMPRMDGLDLLVKLRSDLAPPVPPTILCSGFDLTEEEALRRGAVRFLHKPVSPSELLQAVAEVDAGERPTALVKAEEKERAQAARRRALEEASRLMAQVDRNIAHDAQRLSWLAARQITSLAMYLGVSGGVTALVRDDRLTIVASTGQHPLEKGRDLGVALPPGYEVLETGSALVLPDASTHPSFGGLALGGIRYFMGVPVHGPSGVPVGVMCLFDDQPRDVEAEDLITLQELGRNSSAVLALLARGDPAGFTTRLGGGVWPRTIFEHVLDCELRLLWRQGGTLTLAMMIASDMDVVREVMSRAPSRERLMCCLSSETHLILCKRAPDAGAGDAIAALVAELSGPLELEAAGRVDLAGHGPKVFSAHEVIRLAEVALAHAVEGEAGMLTLTMIADHSDLPRAAALFETH